MELETIRQKHDVWMKRAEDLTNENKLLKREIKLLEEEQDSLNGTVEMLQHQLQQHKKQAKEELRSHQVTEEELQQKVQEQQAMTESMLKELESNRMEMSHMAGKLEAMTVKRKQYNQECHQLQQLVDNMRHKLEDKEMEVNSLRYQIARLTGAITKQEDSHFSAKEQEMLTSFYSDRENKMAESSSIVTSQTKKESRGKATDPKPGVEESHPDDKKCPLRGESVGLGDNLVFHYLTKCQGDCKKGKEKRKNCGL